MIFLINIFRLIFGFVTIKIIGNNSEQILNKASKSGVEIWNLKYKNQSIIGNIGVKNFIKLRKLRRGTKCKIKILKKHGIIFKIKKHKKRTGILIGLIFFGLILYILSNYIWVINIEGNENLNTNEIISSCKKIGIYEGIKKNKINSKYDAQRLQLTQKGIAWCSMNIEGCVLTVNLSESEISDKDERQTPSNIKASIEGKIKKIDATSGDVVVKVGDTVSKGDLLVSGIIQNMSSTLFVHSDAKIIAETKRIFSAKGDYIQDITYETGKIKNRNTINFFGLKIPFYLGNIKKENINSFKNIDIKMFNKKLPIKITKQEYVFTETEKITFDKNKLEELLYQDIKKQVDGFNFISVKEENRDIVYTESGILMKIEYICEENIAQKDIILLNSKN